MYTLLNSLRKKTTSFFETWGKIEYCGVFNSPLMTHHFSFFIKKKGKLFKTIWRGILFVNFKLFTVLRVVSYSVCEGIL